MSVLTEPSPASFQILKHHDLWWILVFVATALCFGWVATIPMSALLFWRAAEIHAEQHMRHHLHRH